MQETGLAAGGALITQPSLFRVLSTHFTHSPYTIWISSYVYVHVHTYKLYSSYLLCISQFLMYHKILYVQII